MVLTNLTRYEGRNDFEFWTATIKDKENNKEYFVHIYSDGSGFFFPNRIHTSISTVNNILNCLIASKDTIESITGINFDKIL